jgi:hypothetical protein
MGSVPRFLSGAVLIGAGVVALSACLGSADNTGASRPSASSGSTPTPELPWAGLEVGGPPKIPYVQGRRYITPNGKVETLPTGRRGVSGVVPYSGGLLVSDATYFEGTVGVELVRHGMPVESWPSSGHCSSGSPIASRDGRYVAWVVVRCPETLVRAVGAVHRARADGSAEAMVPIGGGLVSVVGFCGRSVVYNAGFIDGAWISDFRSAPRRIPGVERVQAVNPRTGWMIGQRGDWARLMLDARGHVRWRARTGYLTAFSPDGTRVLLGTGRREVSVLKMLSGATAVRLDLPKGTESGSTVWETDRTLLTLVRLRGSVAVVRIELDGRVERVTPRLRYRAGPYPYVLILRH